MTPDDACIYCGEPFDANAYGGTRTQDHVVPRSFAIAGVQSASIRGNVVAACGRCNTLKGNMLPGGIRAAADEHRRRASIMDRIADRAEQLINERKLLP